MTGRTYQSELTMLFFAPGTDQQHPSLVLHGVSLAIFLQVTISPCFPVFLLRKYFVSEVVFIYKVCHKQRPFFITKYLLENHEHAIL